MLSAWVSPPLGVCDTLLATAITAKPANDWFVMLAAPLTYVTAPGVAESTAFQNAVTWSPGLLPPPMTRIPVPPFVTLARTPLLTTFW